MTTWAWLIGSVLAFGYLLYWRWKPKRQRPRIDSEDDEDDEPVITAHVTSHSSTVVCPFCSEPQGVAAGPVFFQSNGNGGWFSSQLQLLTCNSCELAFMGPVLARLEDGTVEALPEARATISTRNGWAYCPRCMAGSSHVRHDMFRRTIRCSNCLLTYWIPTVGETSVLPRRQATFRRYLLGEEEGQIHCFCCRCEAQLPNARSEELYHVCMQCHQAQLIPTFLQADAQLDEVIE